jgi:hypothetical protein
VDPVTHEDDLPPLDPADMPPQLQEALRRMSARGDGPVVDLGTGAVVAEDGRLVTDSPPMRLSAAANELAEFNHDTRRPARNWAFPGATYDALAALARLTGRLPQALQQVTVPVTHTYEHGRVLIDQGGDADQAVAAMLALQKEAVAKAQALSEVVERLHASTRAMGLDTEGIPEFADDGEG